MDLVRGTANTILTYNAGAGDLLVPDFLEANKVYRGPLSQVFTWENELIFYGYTFFSIAIVAMLMHLTQSKPYPGPPRENGLSMIFNGLGFLVYLTLRYFLLGRYFLFVGKEIVAKKEKTSGKILALIDTLLNIAAMTYLIVVDKISKTSLGLVGTCIASIVCIRVARGLVFFKWAYQESKKINVIRFWRNSNLFSSETRKIDLLGFICLSNPFSVDFLLFYVFGHHLVIYIKEVHESRRAEKATRLENENLASRVSTTENVKDPENENLRNREPVADVTTDEVENMLNAAEEFRRISNTGKLEDMGKQGVRVININARESNTDMDQDWTRPFNE